MRKVRQHLGATTHYPTPSSASIGASPSLGLLTGVTLVAVATAVFVPFRDSIGQAGPALVLVIPVVAAGLVGGGTAAFVTALVSAAAFNLAFIEPFWTPKIDALEDGIALAVFVLVALAVGILVAAEADRRSAAEQRAREVEALYERTEHLAAERERLAAETARLQALERVDEQRAALLRAVSHDLRTPLATIRAVATDLRDGGGRYDRETEQELLATVSDEAERLDRLVANLLSMGRIEAGALRPERQAVDVEELLADRLRRLQRLFRNARLQLDAAPDLPLVDGDYTMLDQVVTNLLENAARHAPPASTVRVSARSVGTGIGEGAGEVEITVADEGIGVPDYDRDRIFEPFRRGEGSTSSGVGLATCKAIVEAHGGSIRVERTAGGGATFVVRVPALAHG
jgi:two-component system sensor histidine kinase KdpD